MAKFEYTTDVLTSVFSEEKLHLGDLEDSLKKHGEDGWELAGLALNVNVQRGKDGHLLVFKRSAE
jgi:hypothetical protein